MGFSDGWMIYDWDLMVMIWAWWWIGVWVIRYMIGIWLVLYRLDRLIPLDLDTRPTYFHSLPIPHQIKKYSLDLFMRLSPKSLELPSPRSFVTQKYVRVRS